MAKTLQEVTLEELRVVIREEIRAETAPKFEAIDKRFEKIDQKFEQIDQKFEQIDQRFEQIDLRFAKLDYDLDIRFARFEERLETYFDVTQKLIKGLKKEIVDYFTHYMEDFVLRSELVPSAFKSYESVLNDKNPTKKSKFYDYKGYEKHKDSAGKKQ